MLARLAISLVAVAATACGGDDAGGAAIDAAALDDGARIDAAPLDAGADGPRLDAMIDAGGAGGLNGCTEAAALDRTEIADRREVLMTDAAYSPACMRIRAGQGVRWSGDLSVHPLRPGLLVGGAPMPQPGNPIPSTSSGNTVFVAFPTAGAYGYYCATHGAAGMKGAIYVVP